MKEINVEDMELGNLLFGNSRGKYSIPREEFEPVFHEWLRANNFDEYGFYYGEGNNMVSGYKNDTFVIRTYYWGEDEDIANLPNFLYKPKNIEISWYKYSLRDAYCSHDLSMDEFKEMLRKCSDSMKHGGIKNGRE